MLLRRCLSAACMPACFGGRRDARFALAAVMRALRSDVGLSLLSEWLDRYYLKILPRLRLVRIRYS
eukprot:12928573-Prorocentrum_lima.AAC.1